MDTRKGSDRGVKSQRFWSDINARSGKKTHSLNKSEHSKKRGSGRQSEILTSQIAVNSPESKIETVSTEPATNTSEMLGELELPINISHDTRGEKDNIHLHSQDYHRNKGTRIGAQGSYGKHVAASAHGGSHTAASAHGGSHTAESAHGGSHIAASAHGSSYIPASGHGSSHSSGYSHTRWTGCYEGGHAPIVRIEEKNKFGLRRYPAQRK